MGHPKHPQDANRLKELNCFSTAVQSPQSEIRSLLDLARKITGTTAGVAFCTEGADRRLLAYSGLDARSVTFDPRWVIDHFEPGQDQFVVRDTAAAAGFEALGTLFDDCLNKAVLAVRIDPDSVGSMGCLALFDDRPRDFTDEQIGVARTIGRVIAGMLAAHKENEKLAEGMKQAESQSRLCGMTGLLNAAAFRQDVERKLEAGVEKASLILMDLDRFKSINDRFGHPFGDTYISQLAETLQNRLGASGLGGRVGGDEFAVFLECDEQDALAFAKDVHEHFRLTVDLDHYSGLGGVSMGLVGASGHVDGWETLHRRADMALYAAKDQGRNRIVRFCPAVGERYNVELLHNRFLDALVEARIVASFQPVVSLENGKRIGVEALARWLQPGGNEMAPDHFIPAIKDQILTRLLTRRIVDCICNALRDWNSRGFSPGYLSINVSALDVENEDVLQDHVSRLAAAGLDPSRLILEVTESIAMDDPEGNVRKALRSVRARGVRVALDDFGTGYSSLVHLSTWPVDILKIDKCFVRRITTSPRDGAIVRSVVELCGRIGLDVIVEGIETEEQAIFLRELGCRKGQGFLYAPAVSPHQITEYELLTCVEQPTGHRRSASSQKNI